MDSMRHPEASFTGLGLFSSSPPHPASAPRRLRLIVVVRRRILIGLVSCEQTLRFLDRLRTTALSRYDALASEGGTTNAA